MPASPLRQRILVYMAILSLIVVLAAIFVPSTMNDLGGSPVSRVKADLRSLATCVEAYYVDHETYPAWARGERGANAHMKGSPAYALPTFRILTSSDDALLTLTTPVPYCTGYFTDGFTKHFRPNELAVFCYWAEPGEGAGWIAWSAGPDGDYDIVEPARFYDSSEDVPSTALLNVAYDPSNGAVSSGDVWRVKR